MNVEEQLNSQPFYVVTDDAYERMMSKLMNGDKYVKTYIGVCPHKKNECVCRFNLNYLQNNSIVRCNQGVVKKVYKMSDLQQSEAH